MDSGHTGTADRWFLSVCYPYPVFDVIEMREGIGHEYDPGVVVILDHLRPDDPNVYICKRVHIINSSGRTFDATVEAVRDHRVSISFFLRGLTKADVSIGSRVEAVG